MEIHFTKKDFDVNWFSGSGAGGQYRNKHQNCCRITHKETGLRAQSTKYRERPANQAAAFRRLCSMLVAHYSPGIQKQRIKASEVIRNYHAERNEVHDKASGLRMMYTEVVEGGNIGPMIEARRRHEPDE